MEGLFKEALTVMRNSFWHLERVVPQPQIQRWKRGIHFLSLDAYLQKFEKDSTPLREQWK